MFENLHRLPCLRVTNPHLAIGSFCMLLVALFLVSDEFSGLLKKLKINKPIWLTEAMTGKCKVIPTYVKAFANGAEIIIDVGVNAPGMKMSKKSQKMVRKM